MANISMFRALIWAEELQGWERTRKRGRARRRLARKGAVHIKYQAAMWSNAKGGIFPRKEEIRKSRALDRPPQRKRES